MLYEKLFCLSQGIICITSIHLCYHGNIREVIKPGLDYGLDSELDSGLDELATLHINNLFA